jgi:protein-disulfide isomerase
MTKLKADMVGASVRDELEHMKQLAQKLGVNGTPHFLVGDKAIPGAPEDLHNQLEALVADFRKTGCKTC